MQRTLQVALSQEAQEVARLLSRLEEVKSIICMSVLQPERFATFVSRLPKELKSDCTKISNEIKQALFGHEKSVVSIEHLRSMHTDIYLHLQKLKNDIGQCRNIMTQNEHFNDGIRKKVLAFLYIVETQLKQHKTVLSTCSLFLPLSVRQIQFFKEREDYIQSIKEILIGIFKNIEQSKNEPMANVYKKLNALVNHYDTICALQLDVEMAVKDRDMLKQWQLALADWQMDSIEKLKGILISQAKVRRVLRDNLEILAQLQIASISSLLENHRSLSVDTFDEQAALTQKEKARKMHQARMGAFFLTKQHTIQSQSSQIKINSDAADNLLRINKHDEALACLIMGIKALDLTSIELAVKILSSRKSLSKAEIQMHAHLSWLACVIETDPVKIMVPLKRLAFIIENNQALIDDKTEFASDTLSCCFVSDDAIIRRLYESGTQVSERLYNVGKLIMSLIYYQIQPFDIEQIKRACHFFHYAALYARDAYNRSHILRRDDCEFHRKKFIYWQEKINNWFININIPTKYHAEVNKLIKEFSPQSVGLPAADDGCITHFRRL